MPYKTILKEAPDFRTSPSKPKLLMYAEQSRREATYLGAHFILQLNVTLKRLAWISERTKTEK